MLKYHDVATFEMSKVEKKIRVHEAE